jgi:uncharacterized delta-60 repeat protein
LIAGRRRFTLSLLLAIVALALALPGSALAAAGDPDTSFSGDGQLATGFGTTPFHPADNGNAAARLSTGEVYVAGTSGDDFALVRFTGAGVLDTTFGGGDGIAITDISGAGSEDQAFAVSVDTATGNVVVAGQTGNNETSDFGLVRYTSSGALDSGFGGDGIVTTDFPAAVEDVALAVTTLAGGGVVAAGFTDTNPDGDIDANDFALAAYTSSGALDSSFDGDTGNGNGRVTTDFGSDDDFANAALLTTAGSKIVVAGSTDPATVDSGDFAIARYGASTGVLDTTFDGDGRETVSFVEVAGNGDTAYGLATDSSSRILVTGFAGPSNGDCAVARLDGTSGALDNTFSTDGKQVVSTPSSPPTLNTQDSCTSVLVQADGKIVLAGNEGSANGRFLLIRVDGATGTPDPAFDTDGILITDFGGDVFPGAAAVFADDAASKIIAAGTGNDNFAAARYAMSNGALDGTYGVGGKAEADVPHPVQSSEAARGVAVQPDGKVVVAGPTNVDSITQVGGDQQFGVARYNPDGTLDAGFGAGGIDGDGRVSTNFALLPSGAGTDDSAAAVALQSDGKIVVVGKTDPVGSDLGDFAIARYEADGDLDPTFDGDGIDTTDFGGTFQGDFANAVAIEGTPGDPSFRIVIAGAKSGATQADEDFAIVVYDDSGGHDGTFDGDGQQTTDLGSGDIARGVAIQPNGAIVAAGSSGDFVPNMNFAVARYQSNGTPDPSFDIDGQVTTDFTGTSYDDGYSLAVRDLGGGQVRILVGGRTGISSSTAGAMAAYTTDGSLDPSFAPGGADGDGKLTVELESPTNFDTIRALAIRPDGEIVGAGAVESPDFGAIRASQTGTLDPSFGGDGLVSTAFPNPNFDQRAAFGLALQPDGKTVAAGGALNPFNGSDFLVARYAADPSPTSSSPPQQPATPTAPAPTKKKKCKKKKHRAAAAKKCKRKK